MATLQMMNEVES